MLQFFSFCFFAPFRQRRNKFFSAPVERIFFSPFFLCCNAANGFLFFCCGSATDFLPPFFLLLSERDIFLVKQDFREIFFCLPPPQAKKISLSVLHFIFYAGILREGIFEFAPAPNSKNSLSHCAFSFSGFFLLFFFGVVLLVFFCAVFLWFCCPLQPRQSQQGKG